MTLQLAIAVTVALGWVLLALEVSTYLHKARRAEAQTRAVQAAVCAIAAMDSFVSLGESRHEAAARLASDLDPAGFGELGDLQKSTLVAAAYFAEVLRPRRAMSVAALRGIT